MATVAQIQANRLNAQKSTGPRTPEGKDRASQNAVKHGLLAREAVIQGEDPAEFEVCREEMLQTLAPAGPVEAMLAERVVGLSWRLLRAERLQNAAFAALDEGEPTELLEARLEEWKQHKGSERDRSVCGVLDENAALAKAVVEDFAEARVLDRMLVYERRIESSLYRTMAQLRKEREARMTAETSHPQGNPAVDPEVNKVNQVNTVLTPHSKGGLAVDQEPAAPAKLASFGAESVSGGVSRVTCQTPSDRCGPDAMADFGSSSPGGSDKQSLRRLSMASSAGQDHRQTSLPLPPGVEERPFSTLHAAPFTIDPAKRTQSREASQAGRVEGRARN